MVYAARSAHSIWGRLIRAYPVSHQHMSEMLMPHIVSSIAAILFARAASPIGS